MANVKWLAGIRAVAAAFDGYQQASAYRFRGTDGEAGRPLSRMPPRALMVPPGIPDFFTRERLVGPGPVVIEGRAWSGCGSVESVEFSADGRHWTSAQLGPPVSGWAWRGWRIEWEPPAPGVYGLRCRATDSSGAQQSAAPAWNVGGYANNAQQVVRVRVREARV
jgi:hypothetical protein